jgi:hypothetical protein
MTIYVADIASYQAGLDLAALRPDCVAVQIKCTEGSGYVDPDYAGWLAQTGPAHLIPIAYHYVDGTSPTAQAANLAAHIVDKSLPVMLDDEQHGLGLPHILEVGDAMTAAGLNVRLAYLPLWYFTSIGSPPLAEAFSSRHLSLINSNYPSSKVGSPASLYPGDASPLWAGYGGLGVSLLQFTDAAAEGGRHIDVSAYPGTVAQLESLLGHAAPALPPTSDAPAWPGRTFVYEPGRPHLTGGDVRAWQAHMQWRGWRIAADGDYGPVSAAAAGMFQTEFHTSPAPGLEVDHEVGIHTWNATWSIPVTH